MDVYVYNYVYAWYVLKHNYEFMYVGSCFFMSVLHFLIQKSTKYEITYMPRIVYSYTASLTRYIKCNKSYASNEHIVAKCYTDVCENLCTLCTLCRKV